MTYHCFSKSILDAGCWILEEETQSSSIQYLGRYPLIEEYLITK